jgi:U-box domain
MVSTVATDLPIYNCNIPDEFICPITKQIMKHPLYSRYGQTYDRDAILGWLTTQNNTCPMTQQKLYVSDLIRNRGLESRMAAWMNAHGATSQNENDTEKDEYARTIMLTCNASDLKVTPKQQQQYQKQQKEQQQQKQQPQQKTLSSKGFMLTFLERSKRNTLSTTAA